MRKCRPQGSGATLIGAGMRAERSALRAEHRTVLIVRSLRSLSGRHEVVGELADEGADVGDDAQRLVAAAVGQLGRPPG